MIKPTLHLICVFLVLSSVDLLSAGNNEWTRVALPEGVHLSLLFSDPGDPNTLYASDEGDATHRTNGLWKTSDGGATWRPVIVSSSPAFVSALAFDPQNTRSMYAGTWGRGIFKTTDAGETWEPTGRTNAYIASLAIDPQNHSIVYAFDAGSGSHSPEGGIYKTTDEGAHWTNLGRPGSLAWSIETLVIDPKNSSILYAGDGGCCSNGGLYKTTDGGGAWASVAEMGSCYMVAVVMPKDSGSQYAGGSCDGDQLIGQVFKSTDAGATWTAMNSGLPENRNNIWSLVVDLEHPQILYAAFARIGVFKSVNGGASWIPFNIGLVNTNVGALALAPGSSNVLYASTRDGLFKITDSSQLATNVTLDPASVRPGSSFTATFPGTNLTGETYFDVRFRSPDSSTDLVALNWQKGFSATHRVPLDAAPGTWTVNGVRAHQAVDEHDADYLSVAATLMVNPMVVTDVRLDATSVRPGGSVTATFSGTNLKDDTYFDILFRSPGSAAGQVAVNWQRGRSAGHNIPIDTATGTWAIVGVWAHQLPNDHSSDFSPVSATFAVFP